MEYAPETIAQLAQQVRQVIKAALVQGLRRTPPWLSDNLCLHIGRQGASDLKE